MAKDNVEITQGDLLSIWGDVRVRVTALYYHILAEQKALEIANENLDTTRQFFTRVETRYQSGDALQTELLRAKLEVSGAENALLGTDELVLEVDPLLDLRCCLEERLDDPIHLVRGLARLLGNRCGTTTEEDAEGDRVVDREVVRYIGVRVTLDGQIHQQAPSRWKNLLDHVR